MKIIVKKGRTFSLNKDYSQWILRKTGKITIPEKRKDRYDKPEKLLRKTGTNIDEPKENIKENKKKRAKQVSLSTLFSEIESSFTPDELIEKQAFLDYWTEKNPSGRKERWQMERVYNVKGRFQKWLRNGKKWDERKESPPDDGWNRL